MRIITTRRISQIFFFVLFLWFCVTTTLGDQWWQLRGWPVNWLIQLDPLVGLATLLSTRTLYAGLLWGLATVILTILLGRFFCGWLCPFGSLHQFVGYLAKRKRSTRAKLELNRYHSAQSLKYWILVFLLTMAIAQLAVDAIRLPRITPVGFATLTALALLAALCLVFGALSDRFLTFGNATIILPVPGLIFVFALGHTLNPLVVGLVAGPGAALGELTGYLAGYGSSAVIDNLKLYHRIQGWMEKYGKLPPGRGIDAAVQ